MARPAKFDRREALLAAMNAIWKHGFDQSSVKKLSELLGITRSSFYNTFGSQEALLREVLSEYNASSPNAPLYKEVATPVLPLITAVFRDMCKALTEDPESRGCLLVNSVSELCPDTEGLGKELADTVLGSVEQLHSLLELAREGGEIPKSSDTRALALAVQNLMIGLSVFSKVVRNGDELWLASRTTLHGLGLVANDA